MRKLRVVEKPNQVDEIADIEGHLARAYGAAEHTLVLIRPDGYVAVISDEIRKIAELSRVLGERGARTISSIAPSR